MRIWMKKYTPFKMGGNLYNNVATDIPDSTPKHDIGMGFKAVKIIHKGRGYIFDCGSGGLVGNSLEQVREDVKSCGDVKLMRKQIMQAKQEGLHARLVSYEEFFR